MNCTTFFWIEFKFKNFFIEGNLKGMLIFIPLIARLNKSMEKWDNGKRKVIIFMHEVAMTKINWCKEGFN